MALGGLDIGTSGCKCTVMTAAGRTLASRYQAYAVSRTAGAHEVEAAVIWEAVKTVVRGACAASGEPVEALCVTSFGESCVLLDGEGRELAPILLYTDPRGGEQCARLSARMGEEAIYRLSGHRPNPMYFLPKLMWYRDNRPELYDSVRLVLPVNAYVAYRLCGEAATDTTQAARTMMLDIRARDWSGELLTAAGVSRDILPPVTQAGTAVGKALPAVAEELGLPQGAKIVIGCHDQVAAAIGAGALRPGMAVNGSGTVECVTPVFAAIPEAAALFDGGYAVVPAPGGVYVTYAFFFTLPHFAGAATPYMDTGAKGAVCGLSLENDAADVYRSLLEGVAYETRVNLELLEAAGIRVDRLRIKADILGRPIDTLENDEAGTVGSILLAGLATGGYASLDEAMSAVGVGRRFSPAADRGRYDGLYRKYRRVYAAMKQIEREEPV